MPERLDGRVGRREGESTRDQAHGTHGVPDPEELNVDVDRERLLERRALSPAGLVGALEHLVREGDLLHVACWEEADLKRAFID